MFQGRLGMYRDVCNSKKENVYLKYFLLDNVI